MSRYTPMRATGRAATSASCPERGKIPSRSPQIGSAGTPLPGKPPNRSFPTSPANDARHTLAGTVRHSDTTRRMKSSGTG